jgi:hypothetical protein
MKIQTVGSINGFLHGGRVQIEPESFNAKIERHFKKYRFVYKVAGVTLILITSGGCALASTGLEAGARTLYYELANIGKWIIIFKGGIDVVKAIGDGDASTIKKAVITSLLSYLLLLGLPYGMDRVGELFDKVKHA